MSIQQSALRYHRAGLCILPLIDHQKHPSHIKEWKQYQDERPTATKIKEWFSDKRITGIAVVCGKVSGITVIDDDDYKKGKPLDISSPLESITASGGRHIFFKYSPDVKNRNIRSEDNDFEIQNDGKLIVLPPSKVLNKSGKIAQYEWSVRDVAKIKDLPQISEDFTVKYETQMNDSVDMSDLLSVDLGQQHNYLRTLINKLLFQTPQDVWEEQVKPVIISASEKYNPPHPRDRVEKLWVDCCNFVSERKREKLAPKNLSQIALERKAEKELEKNAPSTGYTELDEILKGFIPGRLYLVSGDTNVGKTSISSNFAVNIAKQQKKVLYFALEPANTVIDYITTVANDITYDEIDDYYTDKNITVYTKEHIQDLNHMCSVVRQLPRQDLIIVDHIGYFTTSTNGNTNEAQSNAIKALVQLAKQKRSAIMIIAHVRKDIPEVPTLDDISGSGALKQDATDVMVVVKEKDETSKYGNSYTDEGAIIVLKTKSGQNGFMKIKFKERSAKIYEANQPDGFKKNIKQFLF